MRTLATPPPVPHPPRYLIDPVAFCVALIGGPVLFTALSFWVFLIPVFALFIGGPTYLIIGTPVLLWYLRRHHGDPGDLAFLAFMVMVVGVVLTTAAATLTGEKSLLGLGLGFGGFGLIFAPAWAYAFGRVYQKYRRDFFAKPRPF